MLLGRERLAVFAIELIGQVERVLEALLLGYRHLEGLLYVRMRAEHRRIEAIRGFPKNSHVVPFQILGVILQGRQLQWTKRNES